MYKSLKSPFVTKSAYRRRSSRSFLRTPLRTSRNNPSNRNNIKVCVRVRPTNQAEGSASSRIVVRVVDNSMLVFDPEENRTPSYFKGRVLRDPTERRNKDLTFAFDGVFGPEATNQDLFEGNMSDLLDSFMDGINCTVFAYGATGAGKTHTMLGSPNNPGIMMRTMQELYKRIDASKEDTVCELQVSYLEIYNETIRDLLNINSGPLNIRDDGDQGLNVADLTKANPKDANELFDQLESGNRNRTQHPTDANAESSRSHAVFQIFLKQYSRVPDITSDVLVSKLSLIDLAGSERATVTRNSGDRMREGANINRSLLALGNCINALASGKKGAHVPFRDSKLTRILKDSLGGSCKTLMITNISPSALSYEDTYNALKYADRAKHIKAEPQKNCFQIDNQIHQYVTIIEKQKEQIEELRSKLQESRTTNAELNVRIDDFSRNSQSQFGSFIERLCDRTWPCVQKYAELCRQIVERENEVSQYRSRVEMRSVVQNRLEILHWDKGTGKTERILAHCKAREAHLTESICTLREDLSIVKDQLKVAVQEMGANLPDDLSMLLARVLDYVGLIQGQSKIKHLNAALSSQRADNNRDKALIELLLTAVRQQYQRLLIDNKVDSSVRSLFEKIEHTINGDKEVCWSDQQQNCSNEDVSQHFSSVNMPGDTSATHRISLNSILGDSALYLTANSTVIEAASAHTDYYYDVFEKSHISPPKAHVKMQKGAAKQLNFDAIVSSTVESSDDASYAVAGSSTSFSHHSSSDCSASSQSTYVTIVNDFIRASILEKAEAENARYRGAWPSSAVEQTLPPCVVVQETCSSSSRRDTFTIDTASTTLAAVPSVPIPTTTATTIARPAAHRVFLSPTFTLSSNSQSVNNTRPPLPKRHSNENCQPGQQQYSSRVTSGYKSKLFKAPSVAATAEQQSSATVGRKETSGHIRKPLGACNDASSSRIAAEQCPADGDGFRKPFPMSSLNPSIGSRPKVQTGPSVLNRLTKSPSYSALQKTADNQNNLASRSNQAQRQSQLRKSPSVSNVGFRPF